MAQRCEVISHQHNGETGKVGGGEELREDVLREKLIHREEINTVTVTVPKVAPTKV